MPTIFINNGMTLFSVRYELSRIYYRVSVVFEMVYKNK